MAGKRTLTVVSADGTTPPDLSGPLTRGGFAVRPHPLTDPLLPADAAAVLVLVDSQPEVAAAFTRRCRADAPSPRPVLWLFAADAVASAPTGFDAGADVCLVRPVDPDVLVAQVNALLRTYADLGRVAAKGADAVDLSERLGKLFRQADIDARFAVGTLAAFTPRAMPAGPVEVAWAHAPAVRGGVNTFAVATTEERLRFALCGVGGMGPVVGALLAETLLRFLLTEPGEPAAALSEANRRVRELQPPEVAVLGAMVGEMDGRTGRATMACGGLPPPVLVSEGGGARLWHGGGAFLGQTAGGYTPIMGELATSDRLLLLAGGAAADRRPDVRAAAEEHASKRLSEFVRAVADAVFTPADADDGYTLLAVGRAETGSGTIPALTESEQ